MSLPPKVEITVEQLDGIVWCTQLRHASREELKKRVPFVTAAVEFSGTCPNMKVYSASHFPHSKHPAVESYFASLEDPRQVQKSQGGNEVKKIISTTTEVGGKTTTTTTTTITTIQSNATPAIKYREGHHALVAKWHDDSSDEKLVDSVTFFTTARSYDDAETGTLQTHNQKQNRPHLTLTLPTAAEQHRPSLFTSMFAPCHHHHRQSSKQDKMKDSKDVSSTLTSSTCASTTCSSGCRNLPQHLKKETNPHSQAKGNKPVVKMQDEAHVAPLVATQKSKELAATAIAAEPSSAVVGQSEVSKASGNFTPLSWLTCGTAAPEIVALRVRVMPEDLDEFDDETYISAEQHPASLEGVAHLVFLDQIIEEGTTIMDLPLKMPRQDKASKRNSTALSAAPTVAKGEQGFVTLGPNAMLRVRVTIIPQGKRSTAQQPHRLRAFDPSELDDDDYDDDATSVKTQSLPDTGIPFFSRPFSMNFELFALFEKAFQAHYFQSTTENLTKKNVKVAKDEDKVPKKRGPFPHEFPTVVPDEKSKKEDSSLLGDWKSSGESWGWLRFSSDNKRGSGTRSSGNNPRRRNDARHENKKFYTIPDAPNSSTDSESSEETGTVANTAVYTMEL